MAKQAGKTKSVETPAAKKTAKQKQDKRLTDAYAAVARRNEQRQGDELSELEPVGRKRSAT